jgi:glycosyltransferase involved in cell wall biosynthesis
MAEKLPVVCVFGATGIDLFSSPSCPAFETRELDCRCYANDDDLPNILAGDDPSVIVTIGGTPASFPKLNASASEVSRRWLHFENGADLVRMGGSAFGCFIDNCVRERTDLRPLVSVFTPAYHTGDRIQRPYASLQRQTYRNWEWIIVDDSDDSGETFQMLGNLARADHRLGVFKHHAHSGVLGKVKRWACRLANGQILVELDHDDELTPNCLADVVRTFQHFDGSTSERPLAGFVYSDFAETYPDGRAFTYGPGFALGYGSYRWERQGDRLLAVCNTPNLNPKTIRHIVGVPNHVRSWHRDCYHEAGGHGRHIHVADDYELLLRTFLTTRMARVPNLGYIQWRNDGGAIAKGNTHQERNKEIQRLTRAFAQRYDAAIHQRFLDLGIDDFVWKEGENTYGRMRAVPSPAVESHCTLVLPANV